MVVILMSLTKKSFRWNKRNWKHFTWIEKKWCFHSSEVIYIVFSTIIMIFKLKRNAWIWVFDSYTILVSHRNLFIYDNLLFDLTQNIVQRIGSFSQMTSDSICILSASGTVSSAEIYLPGSRGGVLRYEVRFNFIPFFVPFHCTKLIN